MAECLSHDIEKFSTKGSLLTVYDNLIDIFYKRQDYNKACTYAIKGLELSHKTKYIHMAGNCKINTQDYADAEYLFGKAIESNPKSAAAFMNRGFAKYCQDKAADAIADYEKSVTLNVDDNRVFYHLAVAYQSIEDYEKSYTNYDKYIAGEKDVKSQAFSMTKSRVTILPDEFKKKLLKKIEAKTKDNTKEDTQEREF